MKNVHVAGIAGIALIIFCVSYLSLLAMSYPAEQGYNSFIAGPVDAVYMRTVTESQARTTTTFPFNSTHTFTITKFNYWTLTTGIAVPTTLVKAANLPPPDHYTWNFTGWMVFIGFGCLLGLILLFRFFIMLG